MGVTLLETRVILQTSQVWDETTTLDWHEMAPGLPGGYIVLEAKACYLAAPGGSVDLRAFGDGDAPIGRAELLATLGVLQIGVTDLLAAWGYTPDAPLYVAPTRNLLMRPSAQIASGASYLVQITVAVF